MILLIGASVFAALAGLAWYSAHTAPSDEDLREQYYRQYEEYLLSISYDPREKSLSSVGDDGLHLNFKIEDPRYE